jgi:TRAP-type C4-dicarboxylate transport system substrate-binding protein
MADIKWAPVIAGTVVSNEAWEKVPADLRPQLVEAAARAGEQTRSRIRQLGDDAITQMKQRGLTVVATDKAAWSKEVEAAWPKLRGVLAPADLFDEAIRLRNESRAR